MQILQQAAFTVDGSNATNNAVLVFVLFTAGRSVHTSQASRAQELDAVKHCDKRSVPPKTAAHTRARAYTASSPDARDGKPKETIDAEHRRLHKGFEEGRQKKGRAPFGKLNLAPKEL